MARRANTRFRRGRVFDSRRETYIWTFTLVTIFSGFKRFTMNTNRVVFKSLFIVICQKENVYCAKFAVHLVVLYLYVYVLC